MEIIKQSPQLQLVDTGFASGLNKNLSKIFNKAGSTNNVIAPDKAIMAHKNIPTVL